MSYNLFDYKTSQLGLEERIRDAQACHASDRHLRQQLSQALQWVGRRLIAWSQRVQTQSPTLDVHSHPIT